MASVTGSARKEAEMGSTSKEDIREIKIDKIRPNYRMIYEGMAILALCDDILYNGLREPIVVERIGNWFRIIDGEKRWRACKKLGLLRVKVRIIEAAEEQ
jgi:ParB family transcriptional regulator, chromosome partitioning protein